MYFTGEDIFGELARRLSADLTPMEKEEIKDEVIDNFQEVWGTRGRVLNGRTWANNVRLVDTGALRSSLTSGQGVRVQNNRLTITSNVPYASFVDRRYNFMDLSAGSLERIAEVYTRYMNIG
jgi:hypothetical protein